MSKTLKIWVELACEQRETRSPGKSQQALIAEVLRDFEEAGDAMRYLRADSEIGWKATPRMLDWLADAEREAGQDAQD
jgi:hypothetical protein